MTNAPSRRRRPRRQSDGTQNPPIDGAPARGADATSAPAPREPRPDGATFEDFGLHPDVLLGVFDLGFEQPRPIQISTVPAALAGRDVLGLAQTGTGKTAAFALPILNSLRAGRSRRGPRALVIAPTRELASQILEEIRRLGGHTGVTATVVFGGVPQGAQVRALKQQPDIVVACPGRLLDLVGQRLIDLGNVETLVLDEADHMFDMGFLPHIRRIMGLLPKQRQNLLFSATMPREIRGLADEILKNPVVVERDHSQPIETIEHGLYACAQDRRLGLLEAILDGPDFRSAIVFLRTKHRARRVAKQLSAKGHHAIALQGNMSQGQRERAMKGFRDGSYDVLVATDIAARGIDVAQVSHVVNFDVPNTPEAYTHRIGRTGRAERSGMAFTFASAEDSDQVRAIEKHLGQPIPRRTFEGYDVGDVNAYVSAPKSGRSTGRGGGGGGGRGRGPAGGGPKKKPGGGRSARGGPGPRSDGRPTAFPRPAGAKARATRQAPARQDRSPDFGLGL